MFCPFYFTIVMSVLRFMYSDYPLISSNSSSYCEKDFLTEGYSFTYDIPILCCKNIETPKIQRAPKHYIKSANRAYKIESLDRFERENLSNTACNVVYLWC